MEEEFWLMLREVEQSRTGVPVDLVVDLVHLELPVRRLLARRNIHNNSKEERPALRSQEPVKTGKNYIFVISFLLLSFSLLLITLGMAVRNPVTGEKRGNESSRMSGAVNGLTSGPVNALVSVLVIDREKVIERRSTTETGTEAETGKEKERVGVTEETETVGTALGITTERGVGKGNEITRVASMKTMAEDPAREKGNMSGVGQSKDEVSQRKVMGTTKGVGGQAIMRITSVRRNKEEVTKTVIISMVTVMSEWMKMNTVMMIVSTSGQSDPSRVSIDLIISRRYYLP